MAGNLMTLPSKPPKYKTIQDFRIPQGLYILRTGILNNQLQRLYTGYMNGALTKSQVNTRGRKHIQDMRNTLTRDVSRWLRKFKQGVIEPTVYTEIDRYTAEKIREWNQIVDDM